MSARVRPTRVAVAHTAATATVTHPTCCRLLCLSLVWLYTDKVLGVAGQGTFGTVLDVYDTKHRQRLALKVVRSVQRYLEAAAIEIDILEKLRKEDPRKESSATSTTLNTRLCPHSAIRHRSSRSSTAPFFHARLVLCLSVCVFGCTATSSCTTLVRSTCVSVQRSWVVRCTSF